MLFTIALVISTRGSITMDSGCVDEDWCSTLGPVLNDPATCTSMQLIMTQCPETCGLCPEKPEQTPETTPEAACGTAGGFNILEDVTLKKVALNFRISSVYVGSDVAGCISECTKVGCAAFVHVGNTRDQWRCHTYSQEVKGRRKTAKKGASIYSVTPRCAEPPTAATTTTPAPARATAALDNAAGILCESADHLMCQPNTLIPGMTEQLCSTNPVYKTALCPFVCGACSVPFGAVQDDPCHSYTATENRKPKKMKSGARVGKSSKGASIDNCKSLCNETPDCIMFAYKVPKKVCYLFSKPTGGNSNKLERHADWHVYTQPDECFLNATPPPTPPGGVLLLQPEIEPSTAAPVVESSTPLPEVESSTPVPAVETSAAAPVPVVAGPYCTEGWKVDVVRSFGPSIPRAKPLARASKFNDDTDCFTWCLEVEGCAAAHFHLTEEVCTLYGSDMAFSEDNWGLVGRMHRSAFVVCA